MSELFSLVLLALVQGIAEWLPISSSTHVLLVGKLIGYDVNVLLAGALHLGTLMAVCVYFGMDLVDGLRQLVSGRWRASEARLLLLVGLASIPAGLLGFLLRNSLSYTNTGLLALGLGITSLILFVGSRAPRRAQALTWRSAGLIGLGQVLALFRGVSRSGSTIAPALWLGLSEREAVKFSYLLSIPIILGTNIISLGTQTLPSSLFIATLVAFGVGTVGIHFSFTRILHDRRNLRWFALYTGLLAVCLVVYSLR